jgi:5-methylcytosine-specific restriction endonuclease McrA
VQINEKSRADRRANREKLRLRQEAWRAANPDYMRDWEKRNAALISENNYRRRVRIAEAKSGVAISQRDWDRMIRRFSNRCAYCDCSLDGCFTIDHVVPVSRGGRHSIGNLVPACKSCNSSKRDLLLVGWRRRLADRNPMAA